MVAQNLSLLARACFDRGVAHFQKREWDKAIAAFTDALRHEPAHPTGHYFRGRCHAAAENYVAAVADFTRAIELAPDEAAYNDRGIARVSLGEFAAAIADFGAALARSPDAHVTWFNRGSARLNAG